MPKLCTTTMSEVLRFIWNDSLGLAVLEPLSENHCP